MNSDNKRDELVKRHATNKPEHKNILHSNLF